MPDARPAPRVSPDTGVATEIDAGRRIADAQQRAPDNFTLGSDTDVATVPALPDTKRGDRPVLHVELDGNSETPLAVVDAKTAQQRPLVADREVGWAIMAHLDDAIAEVQCLELGERSPCAEAIHDEHR